MFAERPSSFISVFSNKTPSVFGGAPPTSGGRSKEEEGEPSSSSGLFPFLPFKPRFPVFVFDQTQKSFTHNEQTQILARLMSHASNKRGSLNGPGPKNMTSRTSRQGQERKSVDNTSPPILSSSVNGSFFVQNLFLNAFLFRTRLISKFDSGIEVISSKSGCKYTAIKQWHLEYHP